MIPVRTDGCVAEYQLPDGTGRMPVERELVTNTRGETTSVVISTWEADTDELAAIMVTGRVELAIWGEPIPPVNVAPPEQVMRVKDPPIARAHLERAIHALVGVLKKEYGFDAAAPEDVIAGLDECLLATAGQ